MEFTREELEIIYSLVCQCQYGQIKELAQKIENLLIKEG